MPRPAKFGEHQILDAAARIVSARGASAATIGAIAVALGAPSGSIYHRFRSRDELLGRLWLDRIAAFQKGALAALEHSDPDEAAIGAALHTLAWVRSDPRGARIVLLHRREEFESNGWPRSMIAEAKRLGTELDAALAGIAHRLFGSAKPLSLRAARFAVVDVAYAAVRPHIVRGEPPPPEIDRMVRAAVIASLRAAREFTARDRG